MHSQPASSALLDFLWSPFRALKNFYRDLSEVDDRLRDDSIVVRVLALATIPFQLLVGFLSLMIQNWPTSRSGVAAIAGMPAFFTLLGLLGAWVLADFVRNEAWRVSTNQGYYNFNVSNFPNAPESALSYAKKLVDIDPQDAKLKFQLGEAETRAGNLVAANDAMMSIAPDNPEGEDLGLPAAHMWRARYLVQNKTVDEFRDAMGLAEAHLQMAIDADPESLKGKSELAQLYMSFANRLEAKSQERFDYLLKANELYRQIVEDNTDSAENSSVKITTLGPSVLVRKQLAAIDPDRYSIESEIDRVRNSVVRFLRLGNRFKIQDIRLWLTLMNSASEIRQFDFAGQIADQALKVVEDPQSCRDIVRAKSAVYRKAALNINTFDDFESYKKRFNFICDAVGAAPGEQMNYLMLLQYVGKENPKPTLKLARQLGSATPGDAVPIKPEWLYKICLEPKYTGIATSLIGLQEFHMGNDASAVKNWTVAQEFDINTRMFIYRLLDVVMRGRRDKLDHLDKIFAEAIQVYPEASLIRVLRGQYLMQEKKFPEAIDEFRIVLDAQPGELLLHQFVKECYQYMSKRREAADEQTIIDTKLQSMSPERRLAMQELLRKREENGSLKVQ